MSYTESRCPFCGSTEISDTILGGAEKAVKGIVTGPLSMAGSLGTQLRKVGIQAGKIKGADPQSMIGKWALSATTFVAGAALDAVGKSTANFLSENIPTDRICKKCGKTFHATPNKGWYED